MMAFSISMAVSASRSFGPPSDLVLPPGILPTPDRGSLYSICTEQQADFPSGLYSGDKQAGWAANKRAGWRSLMVAVRQADPCGKAVCSSESAAAADRGRSSAHQAGVDMK